jgi:uncharacterized protein (TIGR02453 family)
MRSAFPGFPAAGVQFFRGLARNNNRDWFQPRKTIFEESVKRPMQELVAALNSAMMSYAPQYVTDPAKAIYRFYRDTRFSKDKSPYKQQIAASFPRRGLVRHEGAGFYCAVSHKEVAVGGGIYMPSPETLSAVRHHIAVHHEELRRITSSKNVRKLFGKLQGEQLSRPPKGFPKEHPAEDLLRMKQFLLYIELPPVTVTTPSLFTEIETRFRAMTPFLEFLNAPLAATRKKIDARELFG